MIPEELELYKELQPYFPQDWRVGDHYWVDGAGGIVGIYDRYESPDLANALHLPFPIDPQDDERKQRGEAPRGLWGMIDWGKHHGEIMPSGDLWIYLIADWRFGGAPKFIGPPTLVLLRALKAQMERRNEPIKLRLD